MRKPASITSGRGTSGTEEGPRRDGLGPRRTEEGRPTWEPLRSAQVNQQLTSRFLRVAHHEHLQLLKHSENGQVVPGVVPDFRHSLGGPGTGMPLKYRPTNSVGGVWARWLPIVGGAFTLFGAWEMNACLSTTP
jgi:hypothetical protein